MYDEANRLFRTTQVTSFFASAGFVGVLFLVPLFLQEARGASPLEAGLTTFPEALGVVTSTQVVARLYPRVGPRRLMAWGLVLMATAIVLLALVVLPGQRRERAEKHLLDEAQRLGRPRR